MATSCNRLTALAALAACGWSVALNSAGPLAALENPQRDSYQSGIGLISGWSCTPGTITAYIDGGTAQVTLPYGSARADTASACGAGNINTGFGLLINYNTLGAGSHGIEVRINDAAVASVQFNVVVPQGEFLTGVAQDVRVADFPVVGKNTNLTWQQSQQNFAIRSVVSAAAQDTAAYVSKAQSAQAVATGAALENPQSGSYQSGIGLISGWSCANGRITATVDGGTALVLPYGSARADTASACGAANTNTGFGLLINYNTLGEGAHSMQLAVNGTPVTTTQFNVTVPAGEFLAGMAKDWTVKDFPSTGTMTVLTWQQSQQNFAIKALARYGDDNGSALFTTYCVCHRDWERAARSSDEIKTAITGVSDMKVLSFLTGAQVDAIALYLYSDWVVNHSQHHS